MNKTILASALLLASTPAISAKGDLWANIHIASSHDAAGYHDLTVDLSGKPDNSSAYREYNESNPGLGLVYEVEDFLDVRGGVFKNSHYKTSVYAVGSIHTSYTNPVSVGLMFGAATGYEARTEQNISIVAMPYASINTKYARVEVNYMPPIGELVSVIGLSIAVTF